MRRRNENARRVPSDYLEFARFLVRCGIDSLSLNPDTVLKTIIIWNRSRRNSPSVAKGSRCSAPSGCCSSMY